MPPRKKEKAMRKKSLVIAAAAALCLAGCADNKNNNDNEESKKPGVVAESSDEGTDSEEESTIGLLQDMTIPTRFTFTRGQVRTLKSLTASMNAGPWMIRQKRFWKMAELFSLRRIPQKRRFLSR